MPASPSPAASSRASRLPFAEALRAPTTATIGARQQHSARPSTVSTGGASSTAASMRRIERLAPAQQPAAEPLDRGEFRLGRARAGVTGAPSRADRRGSASIAAAAEPKRRSSAKNVTGPTLSVRLRRSQSRRSCGSRSRAARASHPF